VLITLSVLESLRPDRPEFRAEREQFERWLREAYRGSRGPFAERGRLIDLYEEAVKRWPSPGAMQRLENLYREREALKRPQTRSQGPLDLSIFTRRPGFIVYELARLYLRAR